MGRRTVGILSPFLAAMVMRYWDMKLFNKRNVQINQVQMQKEILDHWLTMKERNISMDMYLKEINCRKVGIYGLSLIGSHLYEELYHSEFITKLVGIDKTDIYDNYDMRILKPDEPLDDIELVIITAISDYSQIEGSLKKNYAGKIMSIQQVINECERLYTYAIV